MNFIKIIVLLLGILVVLPIYAGENENALYRAMMNDDLSEVKKIIKAGNVDLSYHNHDFRSEFVNLESPLHWAAAKGYLDIVQLLLDKGVNVNEQNCNKVTTLHCAVRENPNIDVVKLLIERGADVCARTFNDETPLHRVASSWGGNDSVPDIIQLLLDKGADINALSSSNYMPLHGAILHYSTSYSSNWSDVVALLIQNGANIHAKASLREGCLHLVSRQQYNQSVWPNRSIYVQEVIRIAQLLLEKGIDIDAKDNSGQTALALAEEHGLNELAELLRNYKKKPEKRLHEVWLRTLQGKHISVSIDEAATVSDLKKLIHNKEGSQPELQRIIAYGEELTDDIGSVVEYCNNKGYLQRFHLIIKPPSSGPIIKPEPVNPEPESILKPEIKEEIIIPEVISEPQGDKDSLMYNIGILHRSLRSLKDRLTQLHNGFVRLKKRLSGQEEIEEKKAEKPEKIEKDFGSVIINNFLDLEINNVLASATTAMSYIIVDYENYKDNKTKEKSPRSLGTLMHDVALKTLVENQVLIRNNDPKDREVIAILLSFLKALISNKIIEKDDLKSKKVKGSINKNYNNFIDEALDVKH